MIRENSRAMISEGTLEDLINAYQIPAHPLNESNVSATKIGKWDDPTWYGGITTMAQAADLMNLGWSQGASRLQTMRDDLSPPAAKSRRRVIAWRDQGDELSIDRALQGNWDAAWRTSQRQWAPGSSVVDLHTMIGGHCNRPTEELFWTGASCVVVADLLESAGYSVRVVADFGVTTPRDYENRVFVTSTVVKEAGEPMRMDAMAALLCHGGIFRTYVLKALLAVPFALPSNLGQPLHSMDSLKSRLVDAGEWPEGAMAVGTARNREECLRVIQTAIDAIDAR